MARYTIQKRPHADGKTVSYRLQVEMPTGADGKRVRKTKTFRTKKEAEAAATKWLSEMDNGIFITNTGATVANVCDQWLAVKRADLKTRTLLHYEATVKTIIEKMGNLAMQKIQPANVDALYALLRDAGKSEDAVHRVHTRLVQVFDYAVKRRIIAANPMLAIDAPTVRPSAPTILAAAQIGRFLTFAQNDGYSPLWLLLVQTGMRRGEALGIRWQDLDLEKGKLSVRQTVECLKGTAHISTPKTAAALRTITLFPESIAALLAHRTRQLERRLSAAEWHDSDLVFASETRRPLNPNNVLRNFYLIQKKANGRAAEDGASALPAFSIHDLRHTHATHLLREGWAVPTVSRRLGHANPGITLTIYAHALSDVHGDEVKTPAAFAFAGAV